MVLKGFPYHLRFSPYDVSKYHGKFFETRSGSLYGITKDGKIIGRPSIEDAKVLMIAGIENTPEMRYNVCIYLDYSVPENKQKLDDLILKHGQEPKPGLRLIISLTPKSVKEKGRYGLMTTPIQIIA